MDSAPRLPIIIKKLNMQNDLWYARPTRGMNFSLKSNVTSARKRALGTSLFSSRREFRISVISFLEASNRNRFNSPFTFSARYLALTTLLSVLEKQHG